MTVLTAGREHTVAENASSMFYRGMALAACVTWSYWPTLVELVEYWRNNDDYSVGALVPFVAVYLAWQRTRTGTGCKRVTCWWGAVVICGGQALRLFGVCFWHVSAERYSLIVTIAGLVLLVWGFTTFWRMRWILAFLLLMMPLPFRVHEQLLLPLQELAARSGTFFLEIAGIYVQREGNILHLEEKVRVGVAEACSGLRMITAFVFLCATVAFMIARPVWQRSLLVLSSIPIALVTNSMRLVATSLVILYVGGAGVRSFAHDALGFAMMPVALALVIFELWLMKQLMAGSGAQR